MNVFLALCSRLDDNSKLSMLDMLCVLIEFLPGHGGLLVRFPNTDADMMIVDDIQASHTDTVIKWEGAIDGVLQEGALTWKCIWEARHVNA